MTPPEVERRLVERDEHAEPDGHRRGAEREGETQVEQASQTTTTVHDDERREQPGRREEGVQLRVRRVVGEAGDPEEAALRGRPRVEADQFCHRGVAAAFESASAACQRRAAAAASGVSGFER